MTAGGLVSDEVVIAVLEDRLDAPDMARGVTLDGFPRMAAQAAARSDMLAARGRRVDAMVSLEVDDAAMVARITGRYTCDACGKGYHDTVKPTATAGVCDSCGATEMVRRPDDIAETVAARLCAYHVQTAPLIAFYDEAGVLARVDAMASIPDVVRSIEPVVRAVGATTV